MDGESRLSGGAQLVGAGLATGPLRRLQLASGASGLGSWTFFVALAVYAYRAGGPTAVGAAALVRMVPAGLAAPAAGVLVDRRPRCDVYTPTRRPSAWRPRAWSAADEGSRC